MTKTFELEQAVIGAIILESKSYDEVATVLKSKMFTDQRHSTIYSVIEDMVSSGIQIDLLTVKSSLSKANSLDKAGGVFYLTELTSRIGSAANIISHATVIAQDYMLKEIVRIADSMKSSALLDSADPFKIIEEAVDNIRSMEYDDNSDVDFNQAVTEAEFDLEQIDKGEIILMPGAPFMKGFSFLPGEVIVIAADSGTGKTSVGMQWAIELDKKGFGGFFSSLEMTPKALAMREMAMEAGVNGFKMRQGNLSLDQWSSWQKLKGIKKLRISQAWTPESVRKKIRSYRKDKKILESTPVFAVIDYVQLMHGSGNGEEKLTNISHALKQVALEENAVVLELAQINREWLKTKDRKPTIHNIRGSDAIRHDADFVFLLYRPEYAGVDTFEDGTSTRNSGVWIIGKSRIGFPDNKQEGVCSIVNGKWVDYEIQTVGTYVPEQIKPRMPFKDNETELKDFPF
jgi:replicative DNA helicase